MQPQYKSPMADLKQSFAMAINLQESLVRQKTLLDSESYQKSKFKQSIEEELRRYFTSYLNIIKRTSNNKIRITDEDLFGNTYNFVKEVMILLSKDYQVMAFLLKTLPEISKLKEIIPSIVNFLYQNLVDDNFVTKDITKLMISVILRANNNEIKPLEQLLISQFLRRCQCKRYGQIISKSILLILTQNQGPTQKIIKDANEYNKESFPQMKQQKTDAPLLIDNKHQYGYLVNDYLKMIINSQFHFPASLRILLKGVELEHSGSAESLFPYFWSMLYSMCYQALEMPLQYQKTIDQSKSSHQRLQLFKQSFATLKVYQKLSEPHRFLINQFLNKLLMVPENILSEFKNPSTKQIRLYSSCLSVQQTIILFQCLLQQIQVVKGMNQKIATRVTRIYNMSEKFTQFSKSAPRNELYCIFYELKLPQQIDVDYQNKYKQIYTQNKPKLIRQIFTNIRPIQSYLQISREHSIKKLLQRIESESNQQQNANPDRLAFFVNIKYFLWMTQEQEIQPTINQMLNQTNNNFKHWISLFSKTKALFTNALYYLRGYSQRARQIDNKLRQTLVNINVHEYLNNLKLNICISSPSSRQKQFHTNGKLVIVDYQRILFQKWDNCVHYKLKLKSPLQKSMHVANFNELIESFCSLDEVKSSIITGVDKSFINMSLFLFLSHIYDQAIVLDEFKNKPKNLKDYLQTLATRMIFRHIFPKEPTLKDLQIYNKLYYFRLLKPKHLGLQLKQIKPIWELTNKYLDNLDKASSTLKKLDALKEFMKVINGILLSNEKPNKYRLQLIILYALLKSQQKQLASNIHFMQIYTDPSRMLSGEGAFVANLKAAINELQDLKFCKLIDIDESAYNIQFQALEKQNGIRDKSQSAKYGKN